MLAGSAANADLCVLKNGSYTLSSKYTLKTGPTKCGTPPASTTCPITAGAETAKPCTDAVVDGNGDIDIAYETGADIVLDVVYEWVNNATLYNKSSYFNSVLYYAGTNDATAPGKMTPKNWTGGTSACNDDPADFFIDQMAIPGSVALCELGVTSTGATNKAMVSTGVQFSGDYFPSEGANFVLDRITFANTFAQTDTYKLDFERDDVGHTLVAPTDVGLAVTNGDYCYVLSDNDGKCAANGITTQAIKTSKLRFTAPQCYIGAPASASVTCAGNSSACGTDPNNAAATVTLTYTNPATCYLTPACDTASTTGACASMDYGVTFNNLAGAAQPAESDGTFTETSNTNVSAPASYTLAGVSLTNKCLPSTSCTTPKTKVATAASKCSCGASPVISSTSASQFTATYVYNNPISLSFKVQDSDTAMSGLSVTYYYANSLTEIPGTKTESGARAIGGGVAAKINANGTFTVTIPKEYVKVGVPIYLGIIASETTPMASPGVYPPGFALENDGTFAAAETAVISGDTIIEATSFAFSSDPYPNRFPFVADNDSANKLFKIFFSLNAPSHVSMRIYTLDGRLVRQIDNDTKKIPWDSSSGDCADEPSTCNRCNYESGCQWDGTDYRGGNSVVGSGMYIVNIHAVANGDLFTGATIDYTKGVVVMK